MKTIGGCTFPERKEEAAGWKPMYSTRALHMKVLCVAKTRIEGTWAAYCAPVEGIDHREEMVGVLDRGVKLPGAIAKVMFPAFADIPYAG